MKIYRFRNCLLNTLERRVIKDGLDVDLKPRTFDVLQLLIEKAGQIVSKDEMLGTVWNGRFVEEGNFPVHISKLRRVLNETKLERFIETVYGNGYRFIAPVRLVSKKEWAKTSSGSDYLLRNFPMQSQNESVGDHNTYKEIDQIAKALNATITLVRSLAPQR